jgi:hypothetical protein
MSYLLLSVFSETQVLHYEVKKHFEELFVLINLDKLQSLIEDNGEFLLIPPVTASPVGHYCITPG